jgi:CheY-like chemotaxis protein
LSSSKLHILYVDDEDPNLISFRAIFRREFTVLTASSADEAREILDSDPDIKVIVSDNIMKGVTGVEFFESILDKHPNKIRIILTGFADQETMKSAINRARVFRFLSKPWNDQDLRQTIYSAVELYDARKVVREQQEILNNNYNKLNEYINSASNDMRSILVSIHGLTKLALTEKKYPSESEYLPLVEKGIMQLDLQLRNIIESYNADNEVKGVDYITFDNLVSQTLEAMGDFYDLKPLVINHRYDKTQGITTNPYRVQLLLNNVLAICLSHKKPESETIEVDLEFILQENNFKIIATDNGVGKSSSDDSLFDEKSNTMNQYNLDLYLTKESTKALGGEIEIDGIPGVGTSISITIPLSTE